MQPGGPLVDLHYALISHEKMKRDITDEVWERSEEV